MTEPIKSDVPLGLTEELTPEGIEWRQQLKASIQPLSDDELKETLGTTVKHDDNNKAITFLCMVTTYTEEDQTNLGYLAGSSTGKSYIPLEIAIGYFPEADRIILGYCSPTAFFHDYGTMLPDPTDKRDIEPEKKRKIIYIDLEKKILVFLDQPHAKLLENLRPLLSHDQKEISIKISDRREKSGLRAKNVVIKGYPTVVFCTANYKQDEQEKTRLLLLSPEQTQEKIREGIWLRIVKEGNREAYEKQLEMNPQRSALRARIQDIRSRLVKQIIIPEELQLEIFNRFMQSHKYLQSRNQRDISRLLTLIKGNSLLNLHQRNPIEDPEDGTTTITANHEDLIIGFKYYATVSEANELGIPPEVYDVYQTFKGKMVDYPAGFSLKEFQKMYYEIYHKVLGRDKAAAFIKSLEIAGLLSEQTDPNDRRTNRYMCVQVGVTPLEQLHDKICICHLKFNIEASNDYYKIIDPLNTLGLPSFDTNTPPPRTYNFEPEEAS